MVDRFSVEMLTKEPNQIELLLNTCADALRKKRKPIILFGSGVIGQYYLDYIKKLDIVEEIYFCDNNPVKWGTTIKGIPVISFDELKINIVTAILS